MPVTKLRPALSYEGALLQVAARLGWSATSTLLDLGERAARNLSDPEIDSCVRLDAAEALDRAFMEAGGLCAPFHDVYATRLELAQFLASSDCGTIADAAALAAKEGGEAVAALLSQTDFADPRSVEETEREIGQAIMAHTAALAFVRRQRAESAAARPPASVTSIDREAS